MIRTLFLAACMHAQAAPVANVMLQPSDRVMPQSVYAAQIQPIKAGTDIAATWLGALALAIILSTAHYLDYPSEVEAAMAASKATADAQNQAQQNARFQRSAQRACGENAAFKLLDETAVQCFTKRGKRTQRIAL